MRLTMALGQRRKLEELERFRALQAAQAMKKPEAMERQKASELKKEMPREKENPMIKAEEVKLESTKTPKVSAQEAIVPVAPGVAIKLDKEPVAANLSQPAELPRALRLRTALHNTAAAVRFSFVGERDIINRVTRRGVNYLSKGFDGAKKMGSRFYGVARDMAQNIQTELRTDGPALPMEDMMRPEA